MAKKKTKKRKVNKSQEARDFMTDNPDVKPKGVSEALAKRGIKMSPQAVSTIKYTMRKTGGPKRRVGKATGSRKRVARRGGNQVLDSLLVAKKMSEQLGGIDKANTVLELHGDTPLNNTPHTRRWGFMVDYDVADLIDKQSRVKLLITPDSIYVRRHSGTMGRSVDDAVIDAIGGSAASGKKGTTLIALPAGQKIAAGSVGLTVDKLIQAKEKLDAAEVDEFIPRFFACQAKQLRNLLEDDKVTSSDFNTVRALVRGELDEYLGFTFVRTERLKLSGSDRLCYGYAMDGLTLGIADEPKSVASPRPDKRMAQQIYTWGTWGAVRVEDEMVVEVSCAE